jgi:hypothetical protein
MKVAGSVSSVERFERAMLNDGRLGCWGAREQAHAGETETTLSKNRTHANSLEKNNRKLKGVGSLMIRD